MIEIWDRNGLLTVAEPVWFFACMFKRHPSIIRHWDDLEEVATLHGVGKDLADGGSRTKAAKVVPASLEIIDGFVNVRAVKINRTK
ncbi:hypothetical protein Y032_0308g2043 [Ancylostoma ceylanicum]|uniref:Uncharacterized protein n=1 Tax=Ancylostoma ceylanicum TaxID=53326 RepID=A0A016S2J4_9BILA|nr:hypothetical protein Y032_0308g2043 [Ancylostoma ceylanicum]